MFLKAQSFYPSDGSTGNGSGRFADIVSEFHPLRFGFSSHTFCNGHGHGEGWGYGWSAGQADGGGGHQSLEPEMLIIPTEFTMENIHR